MLVNFTMLLKSWSVVLLMLLLFLMSPPLLANDYILSTYEASPRNILVSAGATEVAKCTQAIFPKHRTLNITMQQISSFSVDEHGHRDDLHRGFRSQAKDITEYDQYTQETLHRLLHDWKYSHGYSQEDIQQIYSLHQTLNRARTKFLSVESTDGALFSTLRIYDSSKIMKYKGHAWIIKGDPVDTTEIAERIFPAFNLKEALADNGVERAKQTWSIGLLDVSGKQTKALHNLMAQSADLLDQHYNNREFFDFNQVKKIKKSDVDIVFYANAQLKRYYQRVLGVTPLKNRLGDDLAVYPKGDQTKDFYIFHIKGSDFINKFFKLEYHEPLFASNRVLRRHKEVHEYVSGHIRRYYKNLDPMNYRVTDIVDLYEKLSLLIRPLLSPQAKEEDTWRVLAQFFMIKNQLPANLYSVLEGPNSQEVIAKLQRLLMGPLGQFVGQITGRQVKVMETGLLFSVMLMIDFFTQDPMLFLVNRSNLNI